MAYVLILGSSNTDMTVELPDLPAPGQTMLGGSLRTGPGGKGANQAVAVARAGGDAVFITSVGDDTLGRNALALYQSEGIDIRHAKTVSGMASGVALIFVDAGGENMIGVAPGANSCLDWVDIDNLPDGLFRPDGLFLVGGLEIPLPTVDRAVRRASGSGMTVLLNPAPSSALLDFLDGIDVITPNRLELRALTDETNLEDAMRALAKRGPRSVVVTLGAEGSLALHEGEFRKIPSHPVVAVDTVGAGDAFNGALAVALAEKRPLFEAASWASAAAALAVTKPGAQAALPTRSEIDRLFRTSRADPHFPGASPRCRPERESSLS